MNKPLDRLHMLTGLLLGLLRRQMRHWRSSIRWTLRFSARAVCWFFALLPVYLFSQLPAGWLEALLANLATPQGGFVAFYLTATAGIGLAYRVIGRRIEQSL